MNRLGIGGDYVFCRGIVIIVMGFGGAEVSVCGRGGGRGGGWIKNIIWGSKLATNGVQFFREGGGR